MAENPSGSHTARHFLSTQEQDQILLHWNTTKAEYPLDQCIHELFEAQVKRTPDAVALALGNRRLTYQELNARADQLAYYLRTLGVGPEVLVGVCTERSLEMVVGLLAVLKAGGAYLPLDPEYPKERVAFMLQDARVLVLLTQESLVERLPEHAGKTVRLDTDDEIIAQHHAAHPTSGVVADNLAYVIYTSGSTGRPKGVQITHRALLNLVYWHLREFEVTPADRATQLAGLAFDASVWELWPYLAAGASIYMPDEETRALPARLRDWLLSNAVTMSFLPTPLAQSILSLDWPSNSTLRTLLVGGEKLRQHPPPSLPFKVVNNYGPTENTVVATSGVVVQRDESNMAPSIGRPISNVQVYLLDSYLNPVPVAVTGELHIGGVSLARGYLDRPDLTAERFIPNPFSGEPGSRLYKTGDLARYLRDGLIEFLGRFDQQVKIRGFRVELGEIEAILSHHPGVQEAVVLLRQDSPEEESRLVAYMVPKRMPAPTVSELRAFLRERLPGYMVPAAFLVLEALPWTPNGKVDVKALPLPGPLRPPLEADYVAPQTETERTIAALWQEVLGVEKVGIHDNFFDLGGHSLLMLRLHSKLVSAFGRDISMVTMFEYPTINSMAQYLSQTGNQLSAFEQSYSRARARKSSMQRRQKQRSLRKG